VILWITYDLAEIDEGEYYMIVTKDFYKTDVNRFDLDYTNDSSIILEISNVISWDSLHCRITKDELKGLANFIYQFLDN